MSCEGKQQQQQQQLVLANVLCRAGETTNFYVFDLEANKVMETPVATVLHGIGKAGIVRLGSLIYVVGGGKDNYYYSITNDHGDDGKDNYSITNDHGDDSQLADAQYIHDGGTCYFELDKPHLLELLNHPDTLCHSVDSPVKSILGSHSTNTLKLSPAAFSHALLNYPPCASLGGKIYAFTCCSECIGEVFTPQSQDWKCFSPPPDLPLEYFAASSPVIPDEKNDRLLVHFTVADVLYAYYPANGHWDCLDPNFGPWFSATALVDGVLYFHRESPNFLVAYDVTTKSWLKVVHSSPFPVPYSDPDYSHMLHFGHGMLCLPIYGCLYRHEAGLSTTCVQFAKFRVKRANLEEVHVTHVAFNSFLFEGYLLATDFLVL